MVGWMSLVALIVGCGTSIPTIDERTPLDAPDADWMVSVTEVSNGQSRVWTAYSVDDRVEAAAGKGAITIDEDTGAELEEALQAFLAAEPASGPMVPTGVTWTMVIEHDRRQETVVLATLDETAQALVGSIAQAADQPL